MHFTIVCNNGKILDIECESKRPIGKLKHKIAKKFDITKDEIILFFDGIELSDDNAIMMWENIDNPIIALTFNHNLAYSRKVDIIIKDLYGREVKIRCEDKTTIDELKNKYGKKAGGIPMNQISLIYGGRVVPNDKTLDDLRVVHDATMFAVLNVSDKKNIEDPVIAATIAPIVKFNIIFSSLTGSRHMISDVDKSMTVADLKHKYYEREGVPIDQQILVFAGQRLEDDKSLAHYGITRDSTIHLVLNIRGD